MDIFFNLIMLFDICGLTYTTTGRLRAVFLYLRLHMPNYQAVLLVVRPPQRASDPSPGDMSNHPE